MAVADELDHVLPLSRGGDHTESNVQCLCRLCNQLKHNMTEKEFSKWKQADRRGAYHPWGSQIIDRLAPTFFASPINETGK